MSKFPPRLALPDSIYYTRAKRNQILIKTAKLGIAYRLLIILIELIGVYLIDSSALFVDAMASLVDVFSSLFIILCIKLAYRPANREYPYGRGRYEPLSGLLSGTFVFLLVWFYWESRCKQLYKRLRIR